MKISEVINSLEALAPPVLQESYDNAGLLTGDAQWECKGIITTLDVTEDIIKEAIEKGCNLVVAHHPIIFKGLKKLNGKNYVERTIISAIKNDIAIYAIHTNLDNVLNGVNEEIAERIRLTDREILLPKEQTLFKLYTYVPSAHAEKLRLALFAAGAGNIGKYADCSFSSEGEGTFKAGEGTQPFVGEIGKLHTEKEKKLEVIVPVWAKAKVLKALKENHPYEEVAFEMIALDNPNMNNGSGLIGKLPSPLSETAFLNLLKDNFDLQVIRHSPLTGRNISRVALCGGAGSFLVSNALAAKADVYVTGDMKYHEFFDADGRILIADIGHYESEQFTIDLLTSYLKEKFTTFAVLKTGVCTNPVHYFTR